MNDRLQKVYESYWSNNSGIGCGAGGILGIGYTGRDHKPTLMGHFFEEVESIEKDIERIRRAAKTVAQIHESAMTATTADQEDMCAGRLHRLVEQTNQRTTETKKRLAGLKEETKEMKQVGSISASSLRIRNNVCNGLIRRLIDSVKTYQSAQSKYKQDFDKKKNRQMRMVSSDATEDILEDDGILCSEAGRDALYQRAVFKGSNCIQTFNDSVKPAPFCCFSTQ